MGYKIIVLGFAIPKGKLRRINWPTNDIKITLAEMRVKIKTRNQNYYPDYYQASNQIEILRKAPCLSEVFPYYSMKLHLL